MSNACTTELDRSATVVRANDERFNIQSPQRKILIRQLHKALFEQQVPCPFWAVLQVCDIEKLEYMVQLANLSLKLMDTIAEIICALPFKWTTTPSPSQQLESAYSTPTSTSTSSFSARPRASPVAIYAARERDGYKCVITGTRKLYQTTPIFPASTASSRLQDSLDAPSIWRFADVFWGKSTTERWKRAVFSDPKQPDSPVNDCSNLICLRRDLRSAWSSGLFALRPVWVSEDMTEMEIEFYWQPKPDHKLYDLVDVIKEPVSGKNVNSVDRLIVAVGKRGEPTYRAIESGYRFRMTTDDPVLRPLPSFDLLDMQWHFTRLTSLSAMASFFDVDDDGDSAGSDDSIRSDTTTTQSEHRHRPEYRSLCPNPPSAHILAWFKSSLPSGFPPDSELFEDIDAPMIDGAMIGPLPGSDTNVLRSVSQTSKVSESAGSADSGNSEASMMIDVISGTGHLSIDFRRDS